MFQCYSLNSSHPHPLPQSPKVCSLHLCLFKNFILIQNVSVIPDSNLSFITVQISFVTWEICGRESSTSTFNFHSSSVLLLGTHHVCSHSTEENLVTGPPPTASQAGRQCHQVSKREDDSAGRQEVSATLLFYMVWPCNLLFNPGHAWG